MSYLNPISLPFDELQPIHAEKTPTSSKLAAAILIAITEDLHDPEIIYTLRASHLSSHSGQVSFPGGRWEDDDIDLSHTALRESYEEISLLPSVVDLKGTLDSRISANGLMVRPYVGLIPKDAELVANPDEIAAIFKVPVRFFIEEQPSRVDSLSRHGFSAEVPAWNFEGYDIWGLTSMFTCDLMRRFGIPVNKYEGAFN